jgi:hypothetical protein
VLALENRFDLGLHDAVMLVALRHDRDQAGRGNDARPDIRELCSRALRLRIHRAELVRRDVLHPQACAVDGEVVLRPFALARAEEPGDLRLHGGV